MTAVGVQFRSRATCTGLLLPLTQQISLQALDEREQGYRRVRLDPQINAMSCIPCLEEPTETMTDNEISHIEDDRTDKEAKAPPSPYEHWKEQLDQLVRRAATDSSRCGDCDIWVYVPELSNPPTQRYPIFQSYVDTIARGCYQIGAASRRNTISPCSIKQGPGQALCRNVMQTTWGWHPEQWPASAYSSFSSRTGSSRTAKKNTLKKQKVHGTTEKRIVEPDNVPLAVWINDRSNPRYPRGPPEDKTMPTTNEIDEVLAQALPDYFLLRQTAPSPSTIEDNEDDY